MNELLAEPYTTLYIRQNHIADTQLQSIIGLGEVTLLDVRFIVIDMQLVIIAKSCYWRIVCQPEDQFNAT